MSQVKRLIELRYVPGRRALFMGGLVRAVRSGEPIHIRTPFADTSELPPSLLLLVGERAPDVLRGAGLSLGLIAGRLLGRGIPLAGVASGGALFGASALSFAVGAILRIYEFKVMPKQPGEDGLAIVGHPRRDRRSSE